MKKKYLILFFGLFCTSVFCQNLPNDCINFIQACDNQSISYDVSGQGIQEINSCGAQENNSLWLRVTIDQSGTLGFLLKPTSTDINEDYDFWVFGPNSDCSNLGQPIRCSTTNPAAINQSNNYTGMNLNSTDSFEGPGSSGDSFVQQLNVLAGENYFIVIDRPIGASSFTLNWSGTAIIKNPFSDQSFNEFDDVVLCDSDQNSVEQFDFSTLTNQFLGTILGYTVSYFTSNQDASLNSNELLGSNNISPNTYYARISHTNSSCFIVKPINVIFNSVKKLQVFGCDDTPDGIFNFDTTNIESTLLTGLSDFDISYTDQNNNPLPSPLPNPFTSPSQTVNVTLDSTNGNFCKINTTIEFIINNKPQIHPIASNLLKLCNENSPNATTEFAAFDTSLFQSLILGNQTNYSVQYYDQNNMQLSTPLPNPFTTSSQNITVKVINDIDPNCFETGIIPFQVLSLPKVELIGQEVFVCDNLPNYYVTLNAGLNSSSQTANFSYKWYLNNNLIIGQNGYSIQVNKAGNYSVKVTNATNCEVTRTILVSSSNNATIENIKVIDFVDNNNFIVIASGIGDYQYSLDNSTYQDSNFFEGILPGVYTVYVKDTKGCGIVKKDISVYGAPKFFTPNGDNYNDFWNIKGINAKLKEKIIIRIYDRYGRLLDQISSLKAGWDGTLNSQLLPADDYWYTIEFDAQRIVKGHFALIR